MRSPESESEISNNTECAKYSINDLPDEVIEFVLSFVPPYQDLHDCMRVCKRWRINVLNVVKMKRRQLLTSLSNFNVQWSKPRSLEKSITISHRYSHSAVIYENTMYVFGGCTGSMTTFNDLWKLDLSTRQWTRCVAGGIYPTPKACSSMVVYKESLILFGGWAYPSAYPYHQSYQLFNELHIYNILSNKWHYVTTNNPPPMAGHTVTIHGDRMVLFGGMQRCTTTGNTVRTNDIWKLNLLTLSWQKQETNRMKPKERYGHSQIVLNEDHVLIMGGCGGPNGLYSDVWVLRMHGEIWRWKEVEVQGTEWAPPDSWCHPTCKVGNHIVILNRSKGPDHLFSMQNHWRPTYNDPAFHRPNPMMAQNRDKNVNGQRGDLLRREPEPVVNNPSTSRAENIPIKIRDSPRIGLSLSAFNTNKPSRAPPGRNREKQLEMLRKMENYFKNKHKTNGNETKATRHVPIVKKTRNFLDLYLMDISHALDDIPYVTWLEPKNSRYISGSGPGETLLYTLVEGKGELVMFGGLQKDNSTPEMRSAAFDCTAQTSVSSSLHFIGPPDDII